MKWWRKLLSLTNRERLLLIETFLLLGLVRLGLWLLPYQTLLHLLERISDRTLDSRYLRSGISWNNRSQTHNALSRNSESEAIKLSSIVKAVNTSTYYMPGGAKCLARALTTQVLMKQQGYSPQFCIGVTKTELGKLEAHAWIEYQGQIVIGELPNLSLYLPLSSSKKT